MIGGKQHDLPQVFIYCHSILHHFTECLSLFFLYGSWNIIIQIKTILFFVLHKFIREFCKYTVFVINRG